jgi:hypothetical protein
VSEPSEPYKLPQAAEKSIAMMLQEFLDEQRSQLKPKTLRRYESVIELFQMCMNDYAYQSLDKPESALFDQLYKAKGEAHREFCQIFGPEKIPENVHEFLGYFLVRKVVCGKDLKQAAGTVIKKLGSWLMERGYLQANDAVVMLDRGGRAARELPATEDLVQMLTDYLEGNAPYCDKPVEDHFTADKVEPGKLHLSPMMGHEKMVVSVPRAISAACRQGWTIAGAVGRVGKGWHLLEVWNVYP